jgi:putative redox protein
MTQKITLQMSSDHRFSIADGRNIEALNPKELLLYASLDCLSRTIMALLKERTASLKNLELTLEGTLSTPTIVAESLFTHFNVVYNAECHTLKEQEVVSRAINLANDKYCGMLQMLRKIAPLTHVTSIVATD